MRIGIDGNEANVQNLVGVSVYTFKLLEYFQKTKSEVHDFTVYLRGKPLEHMPTENPHFHYKVIGPHALWSQIALPFDLFTKSKIDVFFSPAHYAPRISPVPTVVTIHDLSYFYYPNEFLKKDLYQLKNWTKYSVKRASRVICVSEHTKKDLSKFYDVPDSKVSVIYNGFEKNTSSSIDKPSVLEPYILFVGTLQPRKNITTLIYAFSEFIKTHPTYKLVIVGKKGWLYENIFNLVSDLNLHEKVNFCGYVSDDKLSVLYKHASCFVTPSYYEGFGIPVLEAMSYGCPVIASNTAALPEVGGNACLYFNPHDTGELATALDKIITDKKLRSNLIRKGIERIKHFSWETCAKDTLQILTNI